MLSFVAYARLAKILKFHAGSVRRTTAHIIHVFTFYAVGHCELGNRNG